MSAIERIKGYCCKVTPEQWKELVKVADEVGVMLWERSWWQEAKRLTVWFDDDFILKDTTGFGNRELIPFPDFLAKLRGTEQLPHIGRDTSLHTQKVEDVLAEAEEWTPKAGEMVEVSNDGGRKWHVHEYLTMRNGAHVCWDSPTHNVVYNFLLARPLLPRMTRAEAEKLLNCIITD